MAQGERHHPLLDERPDGIGHPGPATLPGSQHLGPEPDELVLPTVVGRVVDAHHPAGGPDRAQFMGESEHP